MNTTTKVVLSLVAVGLVTGTAYGTHLVKVSNASDKLEIDLQSFNLIDILKSGIWPVGVKYRATFNVKNPSSTDISLQPPNVTVKISDKNGTLQTLASSVPSKEEVTIKGKDVTPLKIDLEVKALNVASVLPDLLTYLMSRVKGAPPTRRVLVGYYINAERINIPPQVKEVLI